MAADHWILRSFPRLANCSARRLDRLAVICIVKHRDAVAIEVQKCAEFCICAQRRAEKYIVGRFVKDFNTSLMKP